MVLPVRPMNFPTVELANTSLGKSASGVGSATGGSPIGGASPLSSEGVGATSEAGADFTAKLREALNEANSTQVRAETAAQDYASGKQNDLHGTMITMTEADVSLRLVANVRNRVIEAYREVMRMGS